MSEQVDWYEDPERPGALVPEQPVRLRSGDEFILTCHLVTDLSGNEIVTLPWAECTVIRAEAR